MKRADTNILLAGVVLLLLVGLWLVPNPNKEPAQQTLTPLKRSVISRITLEHPKAPLIVLEKNLGIWRITAPLNARAEDFQVGNLLELAERRARASYAVSEIPLDQAGLAPPQFRLHLNDRILEFGGTDPLNNQRYVRSGNRIHLITDLSPATLDGNPVDLIDKRPLPSDLEITAMDFGWLKLTRTDKGGWLAEPAKMDRGADAAQVLADAWARARAQYISFVPKGTEFDAEYRFNGPGQEVVLSRVKVENPKEQLILARRDLGLLYHIAPQVRKSLFELKAPSSPAQSDG